MLAKQWIEYSVCGSEHEVAKESATCKLRHFSKQGVFAEKADQLGVRNK